MANNQYSQYVVQDLRTPPFKPESIANYAKFAKRILWMDGNVVPGAYQMNCSWYMKATDFAPGAHTHTYDELIGFFGSNPEDPYDLGGEIEFWIEDEKFMLTRSTMIFVPKNLKHCPMILHRIDRPVFHFTSVNGAEYKVIK